VHDNKTGHVVFCELARPPPVIGMLNDDFCCDDDALVERLFKALRCRCTHPFCAASRG
jgi:hypothetical protein